MRCISGLLLQPRLLVMIVLWIFSAQALAYEQWYWRIASSGVAPGNYKTKNQAEAAMHILVSNGHLLVHDNPFSVTDAEITYKYTADPVDPQPFTEWRYKLYGSSNYTFNETESLQSWLDWMHGGSACPYPSIVSEGDWVTATAVMGIPTYQTKNYHIQKYLYDPVTGPCSKAVVETHHYFVRDRTAGCPSPYSASGNQCVFIRDVSIIGRPMMCSVTEGNPCNVTNGDKSVSETDYSSRTLSFVRSYHTQDQRGGTRIGNGWHHNWSDKLIISSTPRGIIQGNGYVDPLRQTSSGSGVYTSTSASGVEVSQVSSNWVLRKAGGLKDIFNAQGQLIQRESEPGQFTTLHYTDGKLTGIEDAFGRALTLAYDTSGRIETLTDPDNKTTTYAYDTDGNLVLVTYPDTTQREYLYEDTGFPTFITGIIDESGERFATYAYDDDGRVILSEHADGAERVELAYTSTATTVTETIGTSTAVRTYMFTTVQNRRRISSVTGDHCSACGQTAKSTTWQSNGHPNIVTDFNNVQTQYVYNNRGLETQRTEAKGKPQQRTITTQWHGTFRLPTLITEPGRTTAFTYDSSGNKLTETVTDTATSASRTTTWTYNSEGQIETIDGPRTDVSDVTTYEYDSSGNLIKITDALDHETEFTSYDDHGNLLTIIDPNGISTTMTYDARQRLLTRTVAAGTADAATTTFEYYPTGNLKKIIQPDASYLLYTYDDAQRLIKTEDTLGNSIVYTLDNAGNRTEEKVYDPEDTLIKTQSAVFNSLNRLIQTLGADSQTTAYSYDNNGNRTAINAPLSRNTTQSYDNLNRLIQTTNPASGVTGYGYNALDQLTSVTDPRGKVTTYTNNAFGDVTQQVSPDTGTTGFTYDTAGNLATKTDARSKSGTYSYDALNRVTEIDYPDQTITYTYDQGANGIGRLSGITDGSGSTDWSYDAHGRVITREQTVGALSHTVEYEYNNSQLDSLTLPSGNTIGYSYANGQLTGITLNGSTTILSGVLYQPFGPVKSWTWGNSTASTRNYNTDGNVTGIDGIKTYSYDDAFRITGIADTNTSLSQTYTYDLLDRLTDATGTGLNQSWTYDANSNRLTQGGSSSSTYTIAGTNNRISSISGALSRTYTYDAAGNILDDGTVIFTYNDAGRMVSATKASVTTNYALNALGQRVKKTTNSTNTYFVYDEAGHLLGEYDNSGDLIQETVWMADTPVAVLKPNGSGVDVFYIHTDHLNTPRRISRLSDNAILWRWDADPFGATLPNEDPDNDTVLFTYNLRFSGQYFDTETGLHYNAMRDYSPEIGRYTTSDPIGLEGGLNTYLYVGADPISLIDPRGLKILNPAGHAVSAELKKVLKAFNRKIGCDKDIVITGGNRPNSNMGAGSKSTHTQNIAADIKVPGQTHIVTANQAAKSGLFGGVGWYEEGYKGPNGEGPHTHVDLRKNGPARWGYSANGDAMHGYFPSVDVKFNPSSDCECE